MNIWKISLTCESGIQISGEKIGSFIDCLKDPSGLPYIPATHIKGIMRCEAERLLNSGKNPKSHDCSIFGETGGTASGNPRFCTEVLSGSDSYGCDICRLFGLPNIAGTVPSERARYGEGDIRITDFHLADPRTEDRGTDRRPHVVIDRSTQTKETGLLFSGNIVPAGQVFHGFIILRKPQKEGSSENRLLTACIHSMAHYGIGGSRSRGLGGVSVKINTRCTAVEYQDAITKRFNALQEIRNGRR